ncbi:VOC family protein [Aquimarina gracilis]|uniref:VOC family protein n=1 Tax=Aquimarina gracilis TaxID=874422 RepID=A0ABU5ZXT9_9FLAO|nr:VOC family protein [Aquimarina gracilis]MEB3346694.1 VOC family protein [Aquimarina gracilis]
MKNDFKIDFLDHVAIRVKDIELSANWYQKVLGLRKYKLKEWGEFPVFMLSEKSGVALFPANQNDEPINLNSKNIKIDHFAFNVTNENFEKVKNKYIELGLEFQIQNHHYFDSIYTKDPDGHTVELTTLKVNKKEFYK